MSYSENVTPEPEPQSQENEPAQFLQSVTITSLPTSDTSQPRSLANWIAQWVSPRLQARRERIALENLAAQLQQHLETLKMKGNSHE